MMFLLQTLFIFQVFVGLTASKEIDVNQIVKESENMWIGSAAGNHKIAKSLLSADVYSCVCGECGTGIDTFIANMDGPIAAAGKVAPQYKLMANGLTVTGNYFTYKSYVDWIKDDKHATMRARVNGKVNEKGLISELHVVCGQEDFDRWMNEMANIRSKAYLYNMLEESWNVGDIENIVSHCSDDVQFIIPGFIDATASADIIPQFTPHLQIMETLKVEFYNYRETRGGFESDWVATWRIKETGCVFHIAGYHEITVDQGKITRYFDIVEGESISMNNCFAELTKKSEL